MSIPRPHFLLLSEFRTRACEGAFDNGSWHFVLEHIDGASKLEVEEQEPESSTERLALWAVVRGLEALDQPSRVTLVTNSRYVARGLRFGLPAWRDNVRPSDGAEQPRAHGNGDLWRRVDRALRFHEVECRTFGGEWPSQPRAASIASAPGTANRQQRLTMKNWVAAITRLVRRCVQAAIPRTATSPFHVPC